MERKILKQLDLPEYKQPLKSVVEFLDNLSYSAVKTKYNAKGNWDAVSIRGYSDDIGNILKPGVLKSDVKPAELRWTKLYEEPFLLPKKEILKPYTGLNYIWVEDRLDYAKDGLEVGLDTIVMDWPYNREGWEGKRVKSWKEIYDYATH